MLRSLYKIAVRAQFFIVPLLFFSCGSDSNGGVVQYADSTATMVSYDHVMIYAGNGQKRYKMSAPEIRRYEYASEPYTIYPMGLKVLCYSDSIPDRIVADLVADYAILWENNNTWEARGNIVGNNYLENKHFETDILFWDQENGLIYNDHYTKVQDGENWWTGYGFQTDASFDVWRFNHSRGLMKVERYSQESSDSLEYISQPDTLGTDTMDYEMPSDSVGPDTVQLTKMERIQLEEKEKPKQVQMWEEIF